jgi:hypothetical protein
MSVDLYKAWEIVRARRVNLGGLQDEEWTLRVSSEGVAEDEPTWTEYQVSDRLRVALDEAIETQRAGA